MGLSLGNILNVGLGLLGLNNASKAQRSASREQGAASDYYKQLTAQGGVANQNLQSLLPVLAHMANLQYSGQGPQAGFGGQGAPTDYQNDPNYQNAANLYRQPLEAQMRDQLAGYNANTLEGVHQKGYAAPVLQQQLAQNLAQFNRGYMADERTRQDTALQQILGVLQGQTGAGQNGAAGLANLGTNQAATANAEAQAQIQALATILAGATGAKPGVTATPQPVLPAPTGTVPYNTGEGTNQSVTLPVPGASGNTPTEQSAAAPSPQNVASLYPGLVTPSAAYGNPFAQPAAQPPSPYLPTPTAQPQGPLPSPAITSSSPLAPGLPDIAAQLAAYQHYLRSLTAPLFGGRP